MSSLLTSGLRPSRRAGIAFALIGIGTGAVLATALFMQSPASTVEAKLAHLSENSEIAQRRALLNRQLSELIDEEEEANQTALARAKTRLFKTFGSYSTKVPVFAEAVASFKNRLTIAAKSLSDDSGKNEEAKKFIAELFGKHVVSERQLNNDLEKIVSQYRRDLEANRRILIAAAARKMQEAAPEKAAERRDQEILQTAIAQQMQMEQARVEQQTPKISAKTFGGEGITEEASDMLTAQVARIGSSNLLLDVVVKAGTAAGLAIGLGIGYVADEWMSARMQNKIIDKTRKALTSIRNNIWNHPKTGMKSALGKTLAQRKNAGVSAFEKVIASNLSPAPDSAAPNLTGRAEGIELSL